MVANLLTGRTTVYLQHAAPEGPEIVLVYNGTDHYDATEGATLRETRRKGRNQQGDGGRDRGQAEALGGPEETDEDHPGREAGQPPSGGEGANDGARPGMTENPLRDGAQIGGGSPTESGARGRTEHTEVTPTDTPDVCRREQQRMNWTSPESERGGPVTRSTVKRHKGRGDKGGTADGRSEKQDQRGEPPAQRKVAKVGQGDSPGGGKDRRERAPKRRRPTEGDTETQNGPRGGRRSGGTGRKDCGDSGPLREARKGRGVG